MTLWHELLVPFSEYCMSSGHSTEGFKNDINEKGEISNSIKIGPVDKPDNFEICPEHILYLFEKSKNKNNALKQYIDGLKKLNINDFCVLDISYSGDNKAIIYPFGVYIVICEFNDNSRLAFASDSDLDVSDIDFDDSPYYVEQMMLGRLSQDVRIFDDYEIGYPETFTSILENWKINEIYRFGILQKSEDVIDDNELIKKIAGFEGRNAYFYHGFTTPKHKEHWDAIKNNAKYTLIGNQFWEDLFDWFTIYSEVESFTNSEVSIQIFNPANIIGSIYKLSTTNQVSFLPNMEIAVLSEDKSKTFF